MPVAAVKNQQTTTWAKRPESGGVLQAPDVMISPLLLFQYPAWQGPVTVPAAGEVVTIDKYDFQAWMPQPPKRMPNLGWSEIDANQLTVETIFPDKYYRLIDNQNAPKALPRFDYSVIDPSLLTTKEAIYPDKYWRLTEYPWPKPVMPRLGSSDIDPSLLTRKETPFPDKYWRLTEYPWPRPVMPRLGASEIDPVLLTRETVFPDKYWRLTEFPIPGRLLPRMDYSVIDPDLLTRHESIFVDKWFRLTEVPQQPKRLPTMDWSVYPIVFAAPEVVTIDKWFRITDNPLPLRVYPREGYSVIDPDLLTRHETTFPDKWWRMTEMPLQPKRLLQTGHTLLDPFYLSPATIDKWWSPEVLRPVQKVAQQGQAQADPGQLIISPQVFRMIEQPQLKLAKPVTMDLTIGPIVTAPAEVVTIDKWFTLTQIPARRPVPFPIDRSVFYPYPFPNPVGADVAKQRIRIGHFIDGFTHWSR